MLGLDAFSAIMRLPPPSQKRSRGRKIGSCRSAPKTPQICNPDGDWRGKTARATESSGPSQVFRLSHGMNAGGWGGIRTLETLARLPVFKTGAFNHSATHPLERDQILKGGSAAAPSVFAAPHAQLCR